MLKINLETKDQHSQRINEQAYFFDMFEQLVIKQKRLYC